MSVLPRELQYVPTLPSLGENVVNTSVVISPTNGASFGENSIIQFDLPQRGFLDPNSLYIRYKLTQTVVTVAEIKGTPVFTPFVNLQTIFGSSVVENIQNYGQIQTMLTNLTHNAAQKAGLAYAYGYSDYLVSTTTTTLGQSINGHLCAVNETIPMAGPLRCVLSESERLVPLCLMSGVRIQLTLDSLANMFTTTTAVPTAFALTNVELCYDLIDFGIGTENVVRSMGEKIYIKSASYACSNSTLASGSSGTIDMLFNTRLSSVKSLFASFGGTSSASLNKAYDSYDVTSNSGDYCFSVGGLQYPARAISTVNNKAGAYMELKQAIGGVHSSQTNNFGISSAEFAVVGNATTSYKIPAKSWFGVNLEKLSTNGALLTGLSTQSAPVGLRINTSTATAQSHNIAVIAMYDALVEVDTISKNATVKQ